ncbi:helix-turn-helix transcriptional regulator [Thermopolyspora sp. NPDC052614]|uniref:helix-turn-helix domain-containing protein n=1 Tax=Thermopolyspora sp. NPDC052614 TaxID=3155682 RepID=UPI00343F4243
MSLEYEPQPCASPLEYFGYELRRLREEAGKTQDELASIINYSSAHVSAVENAKRSPRKDFAMGCDAALETGDHFVRLWRDLRRALYRPVVRSYFELEATAIRVRTFEPILIPGLLQTEAYARAVIRGNMVAEDDDRIESRVAERRERQNILNGEGGPMLLAVMEESVLHRPIGGPHTMREQLQHLLVVAERPKITLQLIPVTVGAHPGLQGPITLLSFPGSPEVAYFDNAGGGEIVGRPEDVAGACCRFDAPRAEALPQGASIELIRRAMDRWI